MTRFDVAILGAGPAGLAAARAAAGRVALLDDNPGPGGQIWRGAPRIAVPDGVTLFSQTRVHHIHGRFVLETAPHGAIEADRLILATGARELFLPFPGWTEPGMFGAGALQALVKSGLPVSGKRVIVAGSGPLLIAVAALLRERGARVLAIVEQARLGRIVPFLLRHPGKLPQAVALRARLWDVSYWTGVWPVRFAGGRITLSNGRTLEADYIGCGFGLVPNTETAQVLGCQLRDGFVVVDERQETTVPGVFCAGEPTGIGGLEKALEEGARAGGAEIGPSRSAGFVRDLAETFALNPALLQLAEAGTVICRCEGVTREALAPWSGWREAKLQTRCGMGACQGRVCGPVVERLFGWPPSSVRPPIVPVPAAYLTTGGTRPEPGSDRSDSGHPSSR